MLGSGLALGLLLCVGVCARVYVQLPKYNILLHRTTPHHQHYYYRHYHPCSKRIHNPMHAHTHARTHTYTHTRTHTHTRTCTHAHIHAHTHTHARTHTKVLVVRNYDTNSSGLDANSFSRSGASLVWNKKDNTLGMVFARMKMNGHQVYVRVRFRFRVMVLT